MTVLSAIATGFDKHRLLRKVRNNAAQRHSSATSTVRCDGPVFFRSQAARDLGTLLDIDRAVQSWRCLPLTLVECGIDYVPDFLVSRWDGAVLMDACSPNLQRPHDWCQEAAERIGLRYERYAFDPNQRWRLENARDLLAYASHPIPLRERLLLLSCLDEHQALSLSICMQVIRASGNPIGVIAAMAMHRFIEIDLDEGRIGPETRVSRFHD